MTTSSPSPKQDPKKSASGGYPSLVHYLKKKAIPYQLIKPANVKPENTLNVALIQSRHGITMVVGLASHLLDYAKLAQATGGDFTVVTQPNEIHTALNGKNVDLRRIPPFPGYYGLQGVFEENLKKNAELHFLGEEPDVWMAVSGEAFYKAQARERWEFCSERVEHTPEAHEPALPKAEEGLTTAFMKIRMKHRIEEVVEMPAIPAIANEILQLRLNTNAGAIDLANLVEKDPSLAAQLVSWASSPYYGCPVKITSVIEAINRVLGFDLVMNLALGIAISCTLRMPPDGPLGLHAHWRHALYSATLIENIIREMPQGHRPPRGLSYLAGLLQNFGHMLLGQLFMPQFKLLNNTVELNPQWPVSVIEQHVLHVDHSEFGMWLMQAWHMPVEITTAVRWHHHPSYENEHCIYPQLVFLANALLYPYGIGETRSDHVPDNMLEALKVNRDTLNVAMEKTWENSGELDNLVGCFASE